jgi:hypothetical protein
MMVGPLSQPVRVDAPAPAAEASARGVRA